MTAGSLESDLIQRMEHQHEHVAALLPHAEEETEIVPLVETYLTVEEWEPKTQSTEP